MPSHDTSDTEERRRRRHSSTGRHERSRHEKKSSRSRDPDRARKRSSRPAATESEDPSLPEPARRRHADDHRERRRSRAAGGGGGGGGDCGSSGRKQEQSRDRPRRREYDAVETQYESPKQHGERQRSRHQRDSDREGESSQRRERRKSEAAPRDRGESHRRSHHERRDEHRSRDRRRTTGYGDTDSEFDAPQQRDRRQHHRRQKLEHDDDVSSEDDDDMTRDRPRGQYRSSRPPTMPAAAAAVLTEDEKRQALFRKKNRLVSGAIVEEGRARPTIRGGAGNRDTASSYDSLLKEKEGMTSTEGPTSRFWRPRGFRWANSKKKRWIIGGIFLVILIIVIAVGVTVAKNNAAAADSGKGDNLATVNKDSIPSSARGTYLDPFTWYSTDDLNVTYTNATVGDLPIMGLFDKWDDSTRANDKVPPLDKPWGDYTKNPARGVNVGGWLSLEPFITPSLFAYDKKLGIIDEYTLMQHLGPKTAVSTMEKHYATFVNEQTFADIQAAGLDHVRIPFSYWAVEIYDSDPYVFRISWRYLLRAIEYCRKYGLRVNLDLHAVPGSQNGWNHSGRWGVVNWLNGTDGTLNRQRSLNVHDRLSKFFAQDRYKNIIAFYGLANEPRMVDLSATAVTSWTADAYNLVRGNGIGGNIVFGDGFMGLEKWQGKLTGMNKLVLDVHQYVIFNKDQIVYTHQEKVQYACKGWTQQAQISMDTSTGYGPTMFAEWSQADTDCAKHLTNVGWGNRWTGTYASGDANAALTPRCPTKDSSCSCDQANNPDAGSFSASYKQFLKMFAEAQMHSFEKGWGWWYWTWDTESAPLWSYKKGLAAGILPAKAYERSFNCDADVPDFGSKGLSESYKRDNDVGGSGVLGMGLEDGDLVVGGGGGGGGRVDSVIESRITLEELIIGV